MEKRWDHPGFHTADDFKAVNEDPVLGKDAD